jgi:hypothetical protein
MRSAGGASLSPLTASASIQYASSLIDGLRPEKLMRRNVRDLTSHRRRARPSRLGLAQNTLHGRAADLGTNADDLHDDGAGAEAFLGAEVPNLMHQQAGGIRNPIHSGEKPAAALSATVELLVRFYVPPWSMDSRAWSLRTSAIRFYLTCAGSVLRYSRLLQGCGSSSHRIWMVGPPSGTSLQQRQPESYNARSQSRRPRIT